MEEFNILLIVEDKYNLLSIKIPLMQKITDPEIPAEFQMCEDHRRIWREAAPPPDPFGEWLSMKYWWMTVPQSRDWKAPADSTANRVSDHFSGR